MTRVQSVLIGCWIILFWEVAAGAVSVQWNDDVLGLLVFKSDLHDPNAVLSSWKEEDATPCNWNGIKCSSSSGRVEEIYLNGLSLSGQIGRGLLKLDQLQRLSLSRNNLSGVVIPELGALGLLQHIDLSHNTLHGPIPASLGNASLLQYLDMSDNNFSGFIPEELFPTKCDKMVHLSFARNSIEGFLPASIGNCINLLVMDASGNKISGQLPSTIGSLSLLKVMDVSHNLITGEIPSGLGMLKSLTELSMNSNFLMGKIPDDIGNCKLLKHLDLSGNSLSGELPLGIQSIKGLVSLRVEKNHLQGNFPVWISSLWDLEEMDLSENLFEGSILLSLPNLLKLRLLNLSKNFFSGGIPQSIVELTWLSTVDLSSNKLSGQIPNNFISSNLQFVNISSNNLTGELVITSCRSLQVLDASKNILNGRIPSNINQCSNLRFLNLASNSFTKNIPFQLSNLKSMTYFDLSNNQVTGNIPHSITNLSSVVTLNLRKNILLGSIPLGLSSCVHLMQLDLSFNKLIENIPEDLSKLNTLSLLDLSWNNLTGNIPKDLTKLQKLLSINLSHNNLDGPIPTGGGILFSNPSSFTGNAGLCGKAINRNCNTVPKPIVLNPANSNGSDEIIQSGTGNNSVHRRRNRIVLSVSAIIAISAAAVIALGIVLVSVLNIRAQSKRAAVEAEIATVSGLGQKKKKKKSTTGSFIGMDSSVTGSPVTSEELTVGKLVMFTDESDKDGKSSEELLPSAHSLLNKDCEIGRGAFGVVYKAVVANGANTYAVKKLLIPGILRQVDFEREVQQLGKIQHPNLVTLQGYYWTPRMQLLIFDFLPNGNLYSRLHERMGEYSGSSGEYTMLPVLTWAERFRIALGVACGLAHLHHGCVPQVVHYDLKSSNVLLDVENRAVVSDHGLANLLPAMDRYVMSSKFQGALGYMAPEFGCQQGGLKLNEKCDVYGYGVILLEVVTGKRPVEYMEDDVVILGDYVRSMLDEGRALSCVDGALNGHYPDDEALAVLKLGLICTSQVPSNRPSMAEVVHILQLIKPIPDFCTDSST